MRFGRESRSSVGSPYRVPGEVPRPDAGSGAPVEPSVVGILLFVLGCSLLRFGLFVFRSERFGVDPMLALATATVSAECLVRLLRR